MIYLFYISNELATLTAVRIRKWFQENYLKEPFTKSTIFYIRDNFEYTKF